MQAACVNPVDRSAASARPRVHEASSRVVSRASLVGNLVVIPPGPIVLSHFRSLIIAEPTIEKIAAPPGPAAPKAASPEDDWFIGCSCSHMFHALIAIAGAFAGPLPDVAVEATGARRVHRDASPLSDDGTSSRVSCTVSLTVNQMSRPSTVDRWAWLSWRVVSARCTTTFPWYALLLLPVVVSLSLILSG